MCTLHMLAIHLWFFDACFLMHDFFCEGCIREGGYVNVTVVNSRLACQRKRVYRSLKACLRERERK